MIRHLSVSKRGVAIDAAAAFLSLMGNDEGIAVLKRKAVSTRLAAEGLYTD